MVTGYNVDIKHAGKVYHVQTEDRGRKNPIIETLIYAGGKILHQERISYADQNDDAHYSEAAVFKILDLQHKRLIDAIRQGQFETDRKPFGEEFITSRSFDECVLAFLVEEAKNESLALTVVSESAFEPGKKGHVVVRAARGGSSEPIAGAVIHGRIIQSSAGPTPLPQTKTDDKGEATVEFTVPETEGNAAVIVQAESPHGRDELHRLIR